jgi:hypothetical protein
MASRAANYYTPDDGLPLPSRAWFYQTHVDARKCFARRLVDEQLTNWDSLDVYVHGFEDEGEEFFPKLQLIERVRFR